MFKVVPDQLRVSEGWVRCGQCDEVFDAKAHLQDPLNSVPAAPLGPDARTGKSNDYDWGTVAGVRSTPAPVAAPEVRADNSPRTSLTGFADTTHEVSEEGTPAPDPFLEKSPQELSAFLGSVPVDLNLADGNEPAPVTQSYASPESAPSFLTAKPGTSRKGGRFWRAFMAMACVVLGLALAVQVVLHERDRIAATQPLLQPVVATVCAAFGCEIAAFRHIDSVVIDSSSFTKASALTYKLQFTVKNVGTVTVATPALELTLIDTQDRTLVRRVVRVQEFANRQATMAPGNEVTATLPVQVRLSASSDKVAGYRLLAFYP
jgi:predicted Zn finger-like uncharacterized protein